MKKTWVWNVIGLLLTGAGLHFIYHGKFAELGTLEGLIRRSAYEFVFHFMFSPIGIMIYVVASVLALTHLFLFNREPGEGFKGFIIRHFDIE